jgi:zinc transporter ZupT
VKLFSLSTVFRLAGLPKKKTLTYVGMLASVKPIFPWVAILAVDLVSGIELGISLGLAAGTLLYVGICDLLPESFTE